jgi:hypothetical protein
MLSQLVLKDRVGDLALFDQDMARSVESGISSSAYPRWTGANNRYLEVF